MPDPIIVTAQLAKETYDEVSSSYDVHHWFSSECGQRLVDLLPIKLGGKVLDIATGTGKVLVPAARRAAPEGHVTGIDISDGMLQQARLAVASAGLHNVDLFRMDAEHLEFPDSSFDAITCGFGIFFFPPPALDEIYRVCKPGGVIGVSVFDGTVEVSPLRQIIAGFAKDWEMEFKPPRPFQFSPEEIAALLASHGFNHKETFRETKERLHTDVEESWEQLLSNLILGALADMDERTRARFKQDFLNRLKPMLQPEGLHHRVHVIYSIAQK